MAEDIIDKLADVTDDVCEAENAQTEIGVEESDSDDSFHETSYNSENNNAEHIGDDSH